MVLGSTQEEAILNVGICEAAAAGILQVSKDLLVNQILLLVKVFLHGIYTNAVCYLCCKLCLIFHLFIYLFVHLFIGLFFYLFICLFIYLSTDTDLLLYLFTLVTYPK